MKLTPFVAVLLLIGWFILAAAVPGAHCDEWYQGQPGQWVRHGKTWEWRGTHGDQWYQGHRGHWYAMPNGQWYWLSDNGAEYRMMHDQWEWTHERREHRHHHHHHHEDEH